MSTSTGWMMGGGGAAGGLSPMRGSVADLGQTVASYRTYEEAQRAVDYLSDQGFPVQYTAIVGVNLSLVEKVLGRMTTGKAALGGAMSGGWFGLFIGLMFGIFTTRNWFAVVFTGLVIGAAWGAIFGGIAHAATRGTRDFISRSSLAAGSYDIKADQSHAARAASMLASLPATGPMSGMTNTPGMAGPMGGPGAMGGPGPMGGPGSMDGPGAMGGPGPMGGGMPPSSGGAPGDWGQPSPPR